MSFKSDHHREYTCWKHMMQRCLQPNTPKFDRYGGRGITVCNRWQVFENFFEDMGEMPIGSTIDRIDNNGNYEPNNCRWATRLQQANNVERNVYIELNGRKQTVSQWARELSLSTQQIFYRLNNGWSPSCILGRTEHIKGNCPHCKRKI